MGSFHRVSSDRRSECDRREDAGVLDEDAKENGEDDEDDDEEKDEYESELNELEEDEEDDDVDDRK